MPQKSNFLGFLFLKRNSYVNMFVQARNGQAHPRTFELELRKRRGGVMTNTQGNCIKYGKSRNIKQNIAVASYIGA